MRIKEGKTRIKRKFLWFPKTIDKETRWFERATLAECYTIDVFGQTGYWDPLNWIDENDTSENV